MMDKCTGAGDLIPDRTSVGHGQPWRPTNAKGERIEIATRILCALITAQKVNDPKLLNLLATEAIRAARIIQDA